MRASAATWAPGLSLPSILCLLACLGACSDDDEDKASPSPPSGAADRTPEGDPKLVPPVAKAAEPTGPAIEVEGDKPSRPPREGTVWVTGTVNNLGARRRVPRESDTDVCVLEHGDLPCVKTVGQSGSFAIEVPEFAEVALLFRGDKLVPTLRAFVTADKPVDLGNSRVSNELGLASVAKAFGDKLDDTRGDLFFGGLPGVNARLEPASGKRFFINITGGLVEGATSVPKHGSGGFYNVKPGTVGVRFSLPGGQCRFRKDNTFSGWPDPAHPDRARVPVRAGHHTHMVSMFCEQAKPATTAPTAPAKAK